MNKFDRVVTILMLLQTKRIVRAHELSDRFEVSLRTIYRDLKTLENAGVPIHAEAGVGYSLVDGYNLPPVMFTENEATSFLIAEKLVEKMTDEDTFGQFSAAVSKIKAVLKASEKDKINNLESHILVSTHVAALPKTSERRMPEIFTSIDKKVVLEVEYEALYNDKLTARKIEPLGVHFYSNYWHLIAYCQLRKDYRDFRIDRIRNLSVSDNKFENEHPNLKDFLCDMALKQDLHKVRVLFENEVVQFTRTEKFFHGFISENESEEGVEMEFLTPSLHGMAHWLLVFTDRVKILEPLSLKGMMRELTKKLVDNYK